MDFKEIIIQNDQSQLIRRFVIEDVNQATQLFMNNPGYYRALCVSVPFCLWAHSMEQARSFFENPLGEIKARALADGILNEWTGKKSTESL